MCARDEGEMTISPLLESARAFVERRERKVSFLAGRSATFGETIDWGGGIYYAVLCGGGWGGNYHPFGLWKMHGSLRRMPARRRR